MERKKKKRRNMPAHIVLPNGMWRFVKRGSKKASSKRKKGGVKMARRKYRASRRRSGSRGMFGSGKLMNGLFKPTGILGAAILGAGAATLTENLIGKPIGQYTGVAAGFVVGGIPGAAAAYARDMLKGTLNIGGASSSAFVN